MSTTEKIMQAGRVLYFQNVSQAEIARVLDVSETTVSNWVNRNGWREKRVEALTLKRNIQDGILALIDYQLEALRNQTETARLENRIAPLDKGEIDALAKLFATVKGRELNFANVVTLIRELIEHVSAANPDLAKAIVPHTNAFLLTKKEMLTL